MEELWFSLLCRTSELETKVASAKEEITKKEDELVHLKDFLGRAIKAESKCSTFMFFNNNSSTSRHWNRKRATSLTNIFLILLTLVLAMETPSLDTRMAIRKRPRHRWVEKLVAGKPLPEKGKLLQAVLEAGPLLQTLLLAGPLPQWQQPPPRIDSMEIPPVAISPRSTQSFLRQDSCFGDKRSLPHSVDSVFHSNTKYQKVLY